MKICLVLLALLVAVACGHNKDGGSYSAKKADKLSVKESLIEKIHNIKDKIHAKISSKKATKAAKKAQKHGAQPAADCSTVLDDVWEEQCGTKYEPVCRMEMQPHCTSIQAKECAPEVQTRCSFVFEDKCKTISVPKCTIDWEKRCTSTPDCTTIEDKSCTEVEKDVCVTHMDKTCTMSTINVCRKVAVRELTPVDDTVKRTGLKASIKAAHKAHKADLKASLKAKIAAHKAQKKGYTPVDDTVERTGLEAAAHMAHELRGNLVSSGRLHKREAEEFDEDELEAELNELEMEGDVEEQEKLEAELLDVGVADQLLETPREEPAAAVEKPQEVLVNETVSQGQLAEAEVIHRQKRDKLNPEDDDFDYDDWVEEFQDGVVYPENWEEVPLTETQKCDNDKTCREQRALKHCFGTIKHLQNDEAETIKNNLEAKNRARRAGFTNEDQLERLYPTTPSNIDYGQCEHLLPDKTPAELEEDRKRAEQREKDLKEARERETINVAQTLGFDLGAQTRRTKRSLKGDTSDDQTTYLAAKSFHASKGEKGQITAKKADFKGRLETFKAGYKAAKDQYHEAKAQFKATTKALIHAKFNKGPKASKGGHHVKAAVPTITVRYVKTCQDEPRKICSQTPRQECHKEVVPLCKVEPRETCVPKEKCKSWPKKNCGMVHKKTCLPFPTKKCTETSTPVCRIVPRQECTEKKHEICETVPTKDCQKVLVSKPRTVCIPKPTTRTIEDW